MADERTAAGLLSHSAGDRKTRTTPSCVVRVYERPDRPRGQFFMSRAWVTTPRGRPKEVALPLGTTWPAAKNLADLTAAKRKQNVLAGRNAIGEDAQAAPVTLTTLFDRYLKSAESKGWVKDHRAQIERSITFWKVALGPDTPVVSLTLELVEGAAADTKKSASWRQKRIRHIRAAVRWGKRKARLYPENPLEGIEVPEYEPDTDDLVYSIEETRLLCTPHPDVDWRVTLLASIMVDTGRRPSAALALHTDDVLVFDARVFIRFRKEFDKAGRGRLVGVSEQTALQIADALELEIVRESGWLFPEGRLDYDDARDKPWGIWAATTSLHEKAEPALGIPYVEKRAWYGLKRASITIGMEVTGDITKVQDATGIVTADLIRNTYRKSQRLYPHRATAYADAVRGAVESEAPAKAEQLPGGFADDAGAALEATLQGHVFVDPQDPDDQLLEEVERELGRGANERLAG